MFHTEMQHALRTEMQGSAQAAENHTRAATTTLHRDGLRTSDPCHSGCIACWARPVKRGGGGGKFYFEFLAR